MQQQQQQQHGGGAAAAAANSHSHDSAIDSDMHEWETENLEVDLVINRINKTLFSGNKFILINIIRLQTALDVNQEDLGVELRGDACVTSVASGSVFDGKLR